MAIIPLVPVIPEVAEARGHQGPDQSGLHSEVLCKQTKHPGTVVLPTVPATLRV